MEDDRANGAAVGDDMWQYAEISENQIRDALTKSSGNIRRTAKLLGMCPNTFRKFVKRRGMYEEIRRRWIPRRCGGGCDDGEIRQADVARAAGRSRANVSLNIRRGWTMEELLRTPKGKRRTPIYAALLDEIDQARASGETCAQDDRRTDAEWSRMIKSALGGGRAEWVTLAAIAVRRLASLDRRRRHSTNHPEVLRASADE